MSAGDRIAAEVQDWLAAEDADYSVRIKATSGYGGTFYVYLYYKGERLRYWGHCRSFPRRRLRRFIRQHRRFIATMRREGAKT